LSRSFIYAPKVSQEALRRFAVKELIDGFFDGSEEALSRYLREWRRSPEPATRNDGMEAALL